MLKSVLAQIKEYKKSTIITPLMMLLEVAMEMSVPYLMASIIDDGVNKGDINHILYIGMFMVAAAAVGLFSGIMGGFFSAKASAGLAKNLRSEMFRKIQTFSFADIDEFSQASLITRMTTDVNNVQHAFAMVIRMGVRAPASLIVAMVLSFTISGSLSFIYLIAVGVLIIVIPILMFYMKRMFEVVFKRYDAMNESVRENIAGIRMVKAYVREEHEKEKFHASNQNIYRTFIKVDRTMSFLMPLMMIVVYTTILLISWFGSIDIVYGDLTTGELMSLLTYCMNILMSLMMLGAVFGMITISMAAVKRIGEVITHETDLKNPESPIMEVANGDIQFKNVSFGYHKSAEEYVLKNIDLDIKSGETIGIIGGTGSAKTSLINLISRLYDVSEGEVLVGDRDVRSYDLTVLRDSVSVVLQKNLLFSGTIADNLRWGDPDADLDRMKWAAGLACADEFIDRLPEGYEYHIEQGGTNVSGGQRQRLCIARALLKNPKILVLDDSTSAVDTATDAKIRRAFREEIPGTTKIIIAQRISSVQDADRIIVMDDGAISGVGTHEELLAGNEIYRDVYESQTSGGSADFDKNTEE